MSLGAVNMRYNYVDMQLIYVIMQLNYMDIQDNNVDMQLNTVPTRPADPESGPGVCFGSASRFVSTLGPLGVRSESTRGPL